MFPGNSSQFSFIINIICKGFFFFFPILWIDFHSLGSLFDAKNILSFYEYWFTYFSSVACALVTLVASQLALMVKSPHANAGELDAGSTPGSGRTHGEGHGNLLQYSCLENPTDRGAMDHTESDMTETNYHTCTCVFWWYIQI